MPTGVARPIPRPQPSPDADPRLARLRRLAWLLDRSIPIGKWRIGLDPLLGLFPGAGDWLGALIAYYIVFEGARLGLPTPVLLRMGGNVLLEAIVGTVPVVGDLFDFAWQANTRNLRLIDRHHRPELRPRSFAALGFGLLLFLLLLLAIIAAAAYAVFRLIGAAFA